ncbi:MAG TPA: F0F1 ATP synthase subunit B, partial [Candidatus Ozemobacteraceae bacterium]|nr:F0F1 ATP synthase subunit B [Candidatus Ozemobacteraceae bacterium]
MHIDWFTFIAQIVNFFVLVVILRYVLYRPILEALEARRQTVESAVAEAATALDRAEHDRKALSEEREAYEHRKTELRRHLDEEM